MEHTEHQYRERFYERLADAGYIPVLREHGDRVTDMPGHFTCGEYWRLDNPCLRAIVSLDLSQDSNLVATFKRVPRMSPMRRLLDFFCARAAHVPDTVVTAEEIARGAKDIPGADLVLMWHKRLAQSLHRDVKPVFFIDPAASTDDLIMLRGHAEPDLDKIVVAENARGAACTGDSRLGRIGAQQLMGTSVVTLQVPTAKDDQLVLTARRMVMRHYQSQPQYLPFGRFIKDHARLIDNHVRLCQSSSAVQVPYPPR